MAYQTLKHYYYTQRFLGKFSATKASCKEDRKKCLAFYLETSFYVNLVEV